MSLALMRSYTRSITSLRYVVSLLHDSVQHAQGWHIRPHSTQSPGIVIVEVGEEFKDKHTDITNPRGVGWRLVLGEQKDTIVENEI